MTKSLAPDIAQALSERATSEMYASNFYRSASGWARNAGLSNTAKYFANEADQEQVHLSLLLDYLADWNVPTIPALPPPCDLPNTLGEILQYAYDMEYKLGEDYNTTRLAIQHTDLFTYDFLEFYTKRQTEAIIEYNDLIKKHSASTMDLWFDLMVMDAEA